MLDNLIEGVRREESSRSLIRTPPATSPTLSDKMVASSLCGRGKEDLVIRKKEDLHMQVV